MAALGPPGQPRGRAWPLPPRPTCCDRPSPVCARPVPCNGSGEGVPASCCLSPHRQRTCEAGEHSVKGPRFTSARPRRCVPDAPLPAAPGNGRVKRKEDTLHFVPGSCHFSPFYLFVCYLFIYLWSSSSLKTHQMKCTSLALVSLSRGLLWIGFLWLSSKPLSEGWMPQELTREITLKCAEKTAGEAAPHPTPHPCP